PRNHTNLSRSTPFETASYRDRWSRGHAWGNRDWRDDRRGWGRDDRRDWGRHDRDHRDWGRDDRRDWDRHDRDRHHDWRR
ncbi:hypothetical protein, partial [uncultured Novosphingobium sp.]|uniref:hypothetical protein n=1 Tax=uncultured Novosphingobium sp. TaxID=292277 RepID=UPI00259AA060